MNTPERIPGASLPAFQRQLVASILIAGLAGTVHAQVAAPSDLARATLENDRMPFAINVVAAQRARLQLSSKLLSLATIVMDGQDAKR